MVFAYVGLVLLAALVVTLLIILVMPDPAIDFDEDEK